MVTCSICTIGDELMIGQVVDTNSAMIAQTLNQAGITVLFKNSIRDNREDILKTIHLTLHHTEILIITGGLGPTNDDITKSALAQYTGSKRYYRSTVQEAHIEEICRRRGSAMLDINRTQADVPETCTVLENKLGTAPGMWFEFQGKVIVSLPGVPYEAEGLLPQVIERLTNRFSAALSPIVHKTLSTTGIPESLLAKQIALWESELPSYLHLAYLPSTAGVRLRLSCYDAESGADAIDKAFAQLEPILGNAIYGYGVETLEEVVAKLLLQQNTTLSCAESCTGGKIGSLFTSLAGASRYFMGGVIAYNNKIKEEVLLVSPDILRRFGAVSQPCVESMAIGVRKLFCTDYAIATSGIAGPTGGSEEKPLGTVWVAIATPKGCTSQKYNYTGDRKRLMDRFCTAALNMLRITILTE